MRPTLFSRSVAGSNQLARAFPDVGEDRMVFLSQTVGVGVSCVMAWELCLGYQERHLFGFCADEWGFVA